MTRRPWPPVPWEAETQGQLVQQPMPDIKPLSTSVRGARVDFKRSPSGVLVTGDWQTLLRATAPQVTAWQCTFSPVFKIPIGPDAAGIPVVAGESGSPRFRMLFGAGGVSYRTGGQYPVGGGAFTVAADFVQIEVMANDGVTVFTAVNTPAVEGWITERAQPQTDTPFCQGIGDAALLGPFPPSPWLRALHLFAANAGATITLTINGPAGTQSITVPSGTRVPWPASGMRWSAVASAGNACAIEEISFA